MRMQGWMAVAVGGCLTGLTGQSANYFFRVPQGNWNVGTNWDVGSLPGTADDAYVGAAAPGYTAVVSDAQSVRQVGVGYTGIGTVDIQPDGVLAASGQVIVGHYGSMGTMIVRGQLSGANINMGNISSSRIIQYDGKITASSAFDMGFNIGAFTNRVEQYGGSNTFGSLQLARHHGGYGYYTITNGWLTTPSMTLGSVIGGTGGIAVLNVSGSAIVSANAISVGQGNKGYATIEGGSLSSRDIRIGPAAGSYGMWTQAAGVVTCPMIYFAYSGSATGRYVMTGGALNGGEMRFGYNNGTAADVGMDLHGGALILTNNLLLGRGQGGVFTFNQHGGTNRISGSLEIGYNANEFSRYAMNGGELNVNSLYIGGSVNSLSTSELVYAGGRINATNLVVAAPGNATLRLVLPPEGLQPIQVSGTAWLSDRLTIERASNFFFPRGLVVTVMTYNARSGAFAETNFLGDMTCNVNVLPTMITLDNLKPVRTTGTVIIVE